MTINTEGREKPGRRQWMEETSENVKHSRRPVVGGVRVESDVQPSAVKPGDTDRAKP